MTKFCPDNFKPRPNDVEWAKTEFKVSEKEVKRQLELLRDHEFRRNYTDWNRVFRNWMRKAEDMQAFKRERKHKTIEILSEEEKTTDAQKAWAQMKKYGAK